jgi:hypothetical protein
MVAVSLTAGGLAPPAWGEVVAVALSELEVRQDIAAPTSVPFDLGTSFREITDVRIEWSGWIEPGLGHGDGVGAPSDEWFDWPASLHAVLHPEIGSWRAVIGPLAGSFHAQTPFEAVGEPDWDFLMDGRGQVDVSLVPAVFLTGVMALEPTGSVTHASLIVEGVPIVGDLDRNGVVDVNDLIELLMSWGPCPDGLVLIPCPADLDGNGAVDTGDLVRIIKAWD